jgi:hypothetical protein
MPCGPGKLGDRLVPDAPLGLELHTCCAAHDRAYENPGLRSRADCDFEFFDDMIDVVREHAGLKRTLFTRIVIWYFTGVRMFGWFAWWRCRKRETQK